MPQPVLEKCCIVELGRVHMGMLTWQLDQVHPQGTACLLLISLLRSLVLADYFVLVFPTLLMSFLFFK